MKIGAVADHRSREGGAIIYPVYSRRSEGLSVGINLFPDRKLCSFDCPYCEVFPFKTDIAFNLQIMKASLKSAILEAKENNIPIKDICFSGNGEPTMPPFFFDAVNAASAIRSELVPDAKLVLITNGTGLLRNDTFQFLKTAAAAPVNMAVWLKIDAATESWYRSVNRSAVPHDLLLSRIMDFAASGTPFTVQTMLCTINGALPPIQESIAWVELIAKLVKLPVCGLPDAQPDPGARKLPFLRGVQIYGKARPAKEDPLAQAAPVKALEERAALLRQELEKQGTAVPVEVYE
jgi:histidinol dehydrogenase